MTDMELFRKLTIKRLGDIIAAESEKPDDKADFKLIDECEKMLASLLEDEIKITDEEITEKIAKITGKRPHICRRSSAKPIRRLLTVLCAVVILITGVTAARTIYPEIHIIDPNIKDKILSAMGLEPSGRIILEQGGEKTAYDTMDGLMSESGLDILYPHELPEGVKIERVRVSEDESVEIIFSADRGSISFRNVKNGEAFSLGTVSVMPERDNVTFYILHDEPHTAIGRGVGNDNLVMYTIKCTSKEDLLTVVSGMKK